MSTVTLLVQARVGSTRLPGKVLADVGGQPMLALMLARLAPLVAAGARLVVATSDKTADDAVEAVASEAGAHVVRGSEDDVLDRMVMALDRHPAEVAVRLTGDCPLIDPAVVAAAIALRDLTDADFASNTLVRTFPNGLDVEVLRAEVLKKAARLATDPAAREHVTPYVIRRPRSFHLAQLEDPARLGLERWTVDTATDLEVVRRAVAGLDDPTRSSRADVLAVLGRRALDADGWSAEPELGIVHSPGQPFRRAWLLALDGRPAGRAEVFADDGIGRLMLTEATDPAQAEAAVRRWINADLQIRELHVEPRTA